MVPDYTTLKNYIASGTGSDAFPITLVFERDIAYPDVEQAWNS